MPASVSALEGGFQVTCDGRTVTVADNFTLAQPVMAASVDGQTEIIQLLKRGLRGDATIRSESVEFLWDADSFEVMYLCVTLLYFTIVYRLGFVSICFGCGHFGQVTDQSHVIREMDKC